MIKSLTSQILREGSLVAEEYLRFELQGENGYIQAMYRYNGPL